MKRQLFLLFFALFFSVKLSAQEKKSISLKIVKGKNSDLSSVKLSVDLQIYANAILKLGVNHLTPDTLIKIEGETNILYRAVIYKAGYHTTDFYWRFDTLKNNTVKVIAIDGSPFQLKDVVVNAQRAPYKRGDTLVIPVDSIHTQPHASASDLVDKIPGFSVGSAGNVNVLGKNVDKIKVDGVELFGGNPKATLENLHADMLKDVEVLNLTGEGGNGVELNLRLKKDKKDGVYGEVYGQAGNTARYNTGLKFNRVKPEGFLTGFFNYNNQNQQVLSPGEYLQLVNFNNDNTNTLGTQKLYYDAKIEDPLNSLNQIGDRFPFLTKGIHQTLSGGLNFSKKYKKIDWNSYLLTSYDKSNINEYTNTLSSLGELTSQDIKNTSTQSSNYNFIGQSVLKWTPDDKNSVIAKLVLQEVNNHANPSDQSANSLYSHTDTLVNNAVIDNTQKITNKNNLVFLKGEWEHRYSKAAEKTTFSTGLLINNTHYNNLYSNQDLSDGLLSNNNQVFQTGTNYNYFAAVQHSTSISHRLLVDFRLSTLLSSSTINRTGQNVDDNGIDIFSAPLSVNDFRIHNNQTTAQAFLFYKSGNLSIITSVGALNTNWFARSADTVYNSFNRVSFLPGVYLSYIFNKSKISFRYIKEQNTPPNNNLLPVTDSSSVQQVYRGNPMLSPYLSNKYELNTDVFIRGIGSVGLLLNYAATSQPVIDNYLLTGGEFPLQTSTQYKNAQQVSGTLSYFRFNPGKLLNPYFFLFYLWSKQYQLNQQIATPLELMAISPQIGLKVNIGREHSFNLSVQAIINKTSSATTYAGSSSRFNFELKDDSKLMDGLYYKFSTKWIYLYTNAMGSTIKPVTNFYLYEYLGKEKQWQINAGVSNLFNVDEIKLINVGITQKTTSSYNYLQRYFNVGFTFYPEKWKK